MLLSEADTRAKLIDPALHVRGWTEDLIRREETAGAIEIIDGRPRKQSTGRIDYRISAGLDAQMEAVARGCEAAEARLEAAKQRLRAFVASTLAPIWHSAGRFEGGLSKRR